MRKIYIEISDICGLKCSFCPAPKGVRGQMDLRIFEKICKEISQLKKLQKALVCLHILGDPMHRRDIMDFIDCAARELNMKGSDFYSYIYGRYLGNIILDAFGNGTKDK